MKTATKPGSYHDVMVGEYADRGGRLPALALGIKESLEAEHDAVLLIFARSEKLRTAAAKAADIFEAAAESAEKHSEEYNLATFRKNIAKALAGAGFTNRGELGYIRFDTAFNVIAAAANFQP